MNNEKYTENKKVIRATISLKPYKSLTQKEKKEKNDKVRISDKPRDRKFLYEYEKSDAVIMRKIFLKSGKYRLFNIRESSTNQPNLLDQIKESIELIKTKKIKTKEITYEFARQSEIENVGEDVKSSKRHLAGQRKKLAELKEYEESIPIELITKKELVEPLNIDEEIDNGKSAGHIFYHKYILNAIPTKPAIDTNEARKFYYESIKNILATIDETEFLEDLLFILKTEYNNTNKTERWKYGKFLSQRLVNVIINKSWKSEAVRKATKTASSLESGESNPTEIKYESFYGFGGDDWKSTLNTKTLYLKKSTERDYERLRDLLNPKTKGERKRSIGDEIREWRKKELENFLEHEEERFQNKFPTGKKGVENLKNDFNLRAIQFGNYVNDEDRSIHTRLVYGALYDLSNILHMTLKQLSLNGILAIGIGARGSGSASAHFEPARDIINLTKTRGNGAIAHEWFHFLDYYLYSVSSYHREGVRASAFSYRIRKFKNIENAQDLISIQNRLAQRVKNSEFRKRSSEYGSYWTKQEELMARAFESYMMEKSTNHYLVMIPNDYDVYPQGEEKKILNLLFDKFFLIGKKYWNQY
jgi:hypothetical protein